MEEDMASDAVLIFKFDEQIVPRGAIENFGYIRTKRSIWKINNFINKDDSVIPTDTPIPIEDSAVKVNFFYMYSLFLLLNGEAMRTKTPTPLPITPPATTVSNLSFRDENDEEHASGDQDVGRLRGAVSYAALLIQCDPGEPKIVNRSMLSTQGIKRSA
jgi:hypothetical protein